MQCTGISFLRLAFNQCALRNVDGYFIGMVYMIDALMKVTICSGVSECAAFCVSYYRPKGEIALITLHVDCGSAKVYILHRRHLNLLDNQHCHKPKYVCNRDIDVNEDAFIHVSEHLLL